MAKIQKSEVVPGLLVRSARWSEVLVLAQPNSRGMVRCEVYTTEGPRQVTLPYQTLRW